MLLLLACCSLTGLIGRAAQRFASVENRDPLRSSAGRIALLECWLHPYVYYHRGSN